LAPRRAGVEREELIVLLEDECHLVWGDVCGMVWGKRNAPIAVPMANERERQTYYGAINLLTKTVHLQEQPIGDGTTHTGAYLRWCQTLYPNKKLLLLWDGASYHRGHDLPTFLAQENAGLAEADWEITCMLFAPNAPEQNPVEDLWLKGKTYLRKQFAVNKTFTAVKNCFSTFLRTLSFESVKCGWCWPDPQMS
jgi:transposase